MACVALLAARNGRRYAPLLALQACYRASNACGREGTAAGRCPANFHFRHFAKLVAFPLAQTGEGISECELVSWSVQVGDHVAAFDKLCDVQSDKASIEITSRYSGRVVTLHHKTGAVVKVGAPLLDIEVADNTAVAPEHLAAVAGPGEAAPAVAAAVAAGAGTSTTVAAPASVAGGASPGGPAAAVVVGISVSPAPGQPVQQVAAAAAPAPAPPPPAATPPPPPPPLPPPPPPAGAVHASPAVRALARELGIELAAVAGSGPGGRVTKTDVLRTKDDLAAAAATGGGSGLGGGAATADGDGNGHAAAAALAGNGGGAAAGARNAHSHSHHHQRSLAEAVAQYQRLTAAGGVAAGGLAAAVAAAADGAQPTVVPLRGYRRAMVKTMTAAAALPNFHFHDEVVVDRLLAVRAALKNDPGLRAQGVRLTLLPFLIKALSAALNQHPQLNASLAPSGSDLLLHPHHNIGVAMATPSGLVVPNIKQVQRKSLAQVAAELSLLQQLAAAGKLPAEALAGGTISVSNIGTIGGTYATPLVSPPEVAIVALGRLQLLPRYPAAAAEAAVAAAAGGGGNGGSGGGAAAVPLLPVPVSILPVSWGADHRVVDGAALAAFSNTWRDYLEAPERLLLGVV
ncbi:hypothetical protein HXX76_012383 [Chlamydomonas incerta]|uniref:Dihydrolipoamide acetyltransferase component of pyruvate dehydrogenase complex n=1 Tax=Chlamydomonas incerta TaxID=51695 RepID=A0A835SHT3_CHLIN|nr:hypothetical protein HXX76_012383 [Chlamydomonas incerta]|eukprot:KAG2427447.1 hypothetical protein HXX76_012383 [Chlamydomonas incerta]